MDTNLPEVIGRQCCRPLDEMEKAARVLLGDEQCMPNPDTALIGFLCDAVRLCRQEQDGMIMKAKGSNGVYRTCAKCGAHPVQFHYHRHGDDCNTLWAAEFQFEGEHLHFHCSCGYQWREDPLDKQILDKLKTGLMSDPKK